MRMVAALSVLLGLALLPGVARADVRAESIKRQLARKYFELGESHFAASNYEQAVDAFRKAYENEPLPGLLFNLGRTYEALGELDQAINHYELYLARDPKGRERSLAQVRVENIKRRLAQKRAEERQRAEEARRQDAAAKQAAEDRERRAAEAERAQAERQRQEAEEQHQREQRARLNVRLREQQRRGQALKLTGWIASGVGVATLGAGVALGAMASSKSTEYDDALAAGAFYGELQDIDEAGKRMETAQIATLVTGGALLLAGAGFLAWHHLWGTGTEPQDAALLPVAGAGMLGLVGRVSF